VFEGLEQRKETAFWVCGTNKIHPTRKSMKTEFLVGKPPTGYVLIKIFSNAEYKEILEIKNLEEAKTELTKQAKAIRLWSYSTENGLEERGAPSEIEVPSLKIHWGNQFTLVYPQNSTVLLKIAGETSPRYCNLTQHFQLGRR
jgi:hypothetical protein